ncbi:MAG: peptidylprolyl isomerase [Candidatus Zixiibacteriota bacterium]
MKSSHLAIAGTLLLVSLGTTIFLVSNPQEESPPSAEQVSQKPNNDPEIAKINGLPVHKSEFIPYLQDIASRDQMLAWGSIESIPPKVFEAALLNLAQDRLVREAASKTELTEHPQIKALVTKASDRVIKAAYIDQIRPQLVDEFLVKQRYDELTKSLAGKKEYKVRHILLKNEKEAQTIAQALKTRPFEELARLFSLDENTGLRGGDLGYFLLGTLDTEFEAEIQKLKVGRVSQPFKSRFGWHIAIVDEIRDAKPMSLEQATPVIRQQLEQEAIAKWLNGLISGAEIVSNVALVPKDGA